MCPDFRFTRLFFLVVVLSIFGFFSTTQAATFTVDRGDDVAGASVCAGAANDCSFRGAIIASNTGGDVADIINFSIPGGGVHTINILAPLPAITKSVTINGATQSGYFGTPMIEFNGTSAGANVDGLLFSGTSNLSTSSAVYALTINRFGGHGVSLNCSEDSNCDLTLLGNFIGTNPAGTTDLGFSFRNELSRSFEKTSVSFYLGYQRDLQSLTASLSFRISHQTVTIRLCHRQSVTHSIP